MPIQLPTGCFDQWHPQLTPAPTRNASATGTNVQHFQRLGRHWRVTVDLHAMHQAKAEEWADLEDETDTLLWNIPQDTLVAANEGSPRVNGASQTGSSLDIDGATLGFVIPKGAFISIVTNARRYVYKVKAEATATTGSATLSIMPPLRVSPNNNDVVEISAPKIEGLVDFAGFPRRRRHDNRVPATSFVIEERG